MKKKISKIVAVFLAAIMIIAGISPVQPVQAAEKMNFNVKVSSATVKPGDTITAELWLPEGGDVVSFVGNFTYDTKMFEMQGKKERKVLYAMKQILFSQQIREVFL